MARANDSILVTPGSGATIATETIDSKEHEAWMRARATGRLARQDVYVASALAAQADALPKTFLTLFNGAGSGVTLEVIGARVTNAAVASTGTTVDTWSLSRISAAPTLGNATSPSKLKSSSPALPAQVTTRQLADAGEGLDVTLGDLLLAGPVNTTGQGGMMSPKIGIPLWCEPIPVPEGGGVALEALFGNNFVEGSIYFRAY